MRLVGSTMNCSWNAPILLLGISIPRSLKFGEPSTWMPSPHMRNWFPTIKDPETLIATPSSPWARHWSFSTTCTNFSGGQSPTSVLRILDRVVKILFGPTCCLPEKLQKTEAFILVNSNEVSTFYWVNHFYCIFYHIKMMDFLVKNYNIQNNSPENWVFTI